MEYGPVMIALLGLPVGVIIGINLRRGSLRGPIVRTFLDYQAIKFSPSMELHLKEMRNGDRIAYNNMFITLTHKSFKLDLIEYHFE